MVVHSTFFGSIPFCSFTLKSLRSSLFRFVLSAPAPRVDGRSFCGHAFVSSSFASKFVSPLSYASRSYVQNTKSWRRGSILRLFPLILRKQVLTPKTTMLGLFEYSLLTFHSALFELIALIAALQTYANTS